MVGPVWRCAKCDTILGDEQSAARFNDLSTQLTAALKRTEQTEAARDRIAGENARLREALRPFGAVGKQLEWSKDAPAMNGRNYIHVESFCVSLTLYPRHFFDAREALGES